MKKRIRKKLHLGEFDRFGIIMTFDVQENMMDKVFQSVDDFADAHGLYVWGGGHGMFSMQHVKGSYNVPQTVVEIIKAIVHGENEKPLFCLYSPKSQRIPDDVVKEMLSTFASSPYKAKIGTRQISLWHF